VEAFGGLEGRMARYEKLTSDFRLRSSEGGVSSRSGLCLQAGY
jgi:hypothetical protein